MIFVSLKLMQGAFGIFGVVHLVSFRNQDFLRRINDNGFVLNHKNVTFVVHDDLLQLKRWHPPPPGCVW